MPGRYDQFVRLALTATYAGYVNEDTDINVYIDIDTEMGLDIGIALTAPSPVALPEGLPCSSRLLVTCGDCQNLSSQPR